MNTSIRNNNVQDYSPNSGESEQCYSHLTQVRSTLLEILNSCVTLLGNSDTQLSSDIEKRLNSSTTLESLIHHHDDVTRHIRMIIERAALKANYSNDFLTDLSKDLTHIVNHLEYFHAYNKEVRAINTEFNDGLLSHTKQINQVFDTNKGLEEVRRFIISKLSTIAESIIKKRHEDEMKLQAADERINQLQSSLRTYSDEILQVRERADALEKEVLLDQLMQIASRRAYELQIRESLRRYHRNRESFSLIFIDVDKFKTVNDTFGHQAGDRCLREVAKSITFCLRKTDFLARYGGEEIIAVLPGATADDARKVAEKIRKRIEKTVFWHNHVRFSITISAGVTAVTAEDQEPGSLFSRVDSAMYEAKRCGRNRIRVV